MTVRGLTFTYPGADEPVLRDVDLTIPAGGSLALVGATGAGKSTLAALVAGIGTRRRGRCVSGRPTWRSWTRPGRGPW